MSNAETTPEPVAEPRDPVFAAAASTLRGSKPPGGSWVPLLLVAGLVIVARRESSAVYLLWIAAGFAASEAGGFLAIRLLDHPGTDSLLLPFLRPSALRWGDPVVPWKEGIVLLAGPMSMLAITLALSAASLIVGSPVLPDLASVCLWLGGVALLPLGSSAGARLLGLVVFSRWRIVELVFFLVMQALLFLFLWETQAVMFLVLGGISAIAAVQTYRIAREAALVRARRPSLARRPADLDDAEVLDLFASAGRILPASIVTKASAGDLSVAPGYAAVMRNVHARATVSPPTVLQSVGLLYLYGMALGGSAVVLVLHGLSMK